MHLLLRSYDPESGSVSLDGKDIKKALSLKRSRAQFGLVQQEPVMFERTIRENIAYGDNTRDVPVDEIIDAATKANVHSFISSLPSGYETVLEAGSAALSGGQKQRTVQQALETASTGRSTVIIAHRLATVRHAHVICVIDRGKYNIFLAKQK
ncbi:unnamed protein product [Leptidea sinapis]|uniref:ABC transporter domain-containing protein n=1 Tax=Leptidea sinapis TaxID=189913 RepID=A0A5E4R4G3_9NEOP|nr:unnamed protein product [Leptidea sinapis]